MAANIVTLSTNPVVGIINVFRWDLSTYHQDMAMCVRNTTGKRAKRIAIALSEGFERRKISWRRTV